MINGNSLSRCVASAVWALAGLAHGQDNAIFYPQQGAWWLYYKDPDSNQWTSKIYNQQNATKPVVRSIIRWKGSNLLYDYRVGNKVDAKQTIDSFTIWSIPILLQVPGLLPITADMETQQTVEVYLAVCKEKGIESRRNFSGKFNLRISPELHERLAIAAQAEGKSINSIAQEALQMRVVS